MKCVKKSESVTHIWVTEGGEELSFSSNLQSVAISTTSASQFVPQRPPPHKALENGVAGRFALPFRSQTS
jgi:hypothetical protein